MHLATYLHSVMRGNSPKRGNWGTGRVLLGASLFCALFGGACSRAEDWESSEITKDLSSYGESLGSFKFTVDTSAVEPVTVERLGTLGDGMSPPGQELQTTEDLGGDASVFSHVAVTGPGTWHGPPINELRAEVVITHRALTSNAFDEPQLVVTAFSKSGPGEVTFVSRHGGGDNQGAVIAFSDIQSNSSLNRCPGFGVRTSAKHALRIHVTEAPTTTFSFTVDVRAHPVAANAAVIAPDCDNDGFNPELGEDAGNDCNDRNPSLRTGCSCTSGENQCTTAGGDCTPSGPGGGTVSCSNGSPCPCNVKCANGAEGCGISSCQTTTCNNTCHDNQGTSGACGVTTCSSAATCNSFCHDNQDTSGTCGVTSCSGNSDCGTVCQNNAGTQGTCGVGTCTGGSRCNALCQDNAGTQGTCGVKTCEGGSTCNTTCQDNADTGGTCGVETCRGGAKCNAACQDNASTQGTCGVKTCEGGSTCNLQCTDNQQNCGITLCKSNCNVSCQGDNASCGITECEWGQCSVACGCLEPGCTQQGNHGICGIGACVGNNCTVTCGNIAPGDSCFLGCTGWGTCRMDCTRIPAAERAAKCDLVCSAGSRQKRQVPGMPAGWFECH